MLEGEYRRGVKRKTRRTRLKGIHPFHSNQERGEWDPTIIHVFPPYFVHRYVAGGFVWRYMESIFRSGGRLILAEASDPKWKQHDYNFTLPLFVFCHFCGYQTTSMYAWSCACCPGNIASPSSPSPSYVISLPLGPWQTHQTGRKWSALLGRLSGLPLDLWPTDNVYHSTERGRGERGRAVLGLEAERERKHKAGEQSDPKLHLHTELSKLTWATSGKRSLNYDTVNILNTFAGQTRAAWAVCWIYYANWKLTAHFLLLCKRQMRRNKHKFCWVINCRGWHGAEIWLMFSLTFTSHFYSWKVQSKTRTNWWRTAVTTGTYLFFCVFIVRHAFSFCFLLLSGINLLIVSGSAIDGDAGARAAW